MLRAQELTLRPVEKAILAGRSAWICAAAGWGVLLVVLAARSLSGALTTPNAWGALLCGLIASLGALGLTASRSEPAKVLSDRHGLRLGFAIALVLFAAAMTVSFLSLPGLLGLWAPVIIAGAILGAPALRAKPAAEELGNDEGAAGDAAAAKGAAWQETARFLTDDGKDVIEGRVTIRMPAGERVAISHVSFCPPFGVVPRFSFSTEGDTPVRIKLSQLLPQGARFEARLETLLGSAVEARIWFSAEEDGAMESEAARGRQPAQA